MTYGSLFAGTGGLDLGLERAGMRCAWQVEIDAFCRDVLAKHWGGVTRYGDIRQLRGSGLEPVDLIAGGFPCQDVSYIGKQAGIEGSRSGLWFEFARLVGELRPRWVLVENVSGLLVYDGMRRVVGELARLGYVGIWRRLRATEFGFSHLRGRIFIIAVDHAQRPRLEVGNRIGEQFPRQDPEPLAAGLPALRAPGPADPVWEDVLARHPDLSPALAAQSKVSRVVDGDAGWVDRALADAKHRIGALGNGAVPDVVEWIGRRIREYDGAAR